MKRSLNFLVFTIICTIVAVVLSFSAGFIDLNNTKLINVFVVLVQIITIMADAFLLVGCLFGKIAGNRCFTIAFWLDIGLITVNIVTLILSVAGVTSSSANNIISVLSLIASIGTFLFVILGCREAESSVSKLAITTLIFVSLGLLLTGIVPFFSNQQSDGIVALTVFGSIAFLVGCILFVVLVIKTRNRVTD